MGAALVIAAATFRGGRLVRSDLPPASPAPEGKPLEADQKLRAVLEGASDQTLVTEICARHGISEGEFAEWAETSRAAAEHALKA